MGICRPTGRCHIIGRNRFLHHSADKAVVQRVEGPTVLIKWVACELGDVGAARMYSLRDTVACRPKRGSDGAIVDRV